MIGNTVQYTAAFESAKKRRDILKFTKDASFMPKIQSPIDMNNDAFKKLTRSVTGNQSIRQDFLKKTKESTSALGESTHANSNSAT